MIFLDADHDWILARDRRKLVDALLERIDPNDDDHLLRLAAACLGCDIEDIIFLEYHGGNLVQSGLPLRVPAL